MYRLVIIPDPSGLFTEILPIDDLFSHVASKFNFFWLIFNKEYYSQGLNISYESASSTDSYSFFQSPGDSVDTGSMDTDIP